MEPPTFSLFASTARFFRASAAIALTCASLLGSAALLQAGVLWSDDFNSYTDGSLAHQSGGGAGTPGWGPNNWFSADGTVNVTAGLVNGDGNIRHGLTQTFAATVGPTGTIWVSFDWGHDSENTTGTYGGLTFFGATERALIGNTWNAPTWSVSNPGTTNTTPTNIGIKTAVAKITLGAGETDDTIDLWVGPTGSPVDVSGTPMVTGTGLELGDVDQIRIMGNNPQTFDNLVIGTDITDVNAIDGSPPPPTAGTWTNTTGGTWGTAGNWLSDTVATGSDSTADFNTLDITADTAVNLGSPQTIGKLVFGDTDTSSAAGWTLAGNTLTLDGTTPTITVNALGDSKTTTISAAVAGSAGLTKDGSGALTLTGANTYTGATNVDAGTLQVSGQAYFNVGRTTTVASGAVFELNDSNNTFTSPMPVSTITGTGTFRLSGNSTIYQAGNGDASNRLTFAMNAGGWIDLQGSSRLTNGGWQLVNWTDNKASMNIASGATLDLWDGQDVTIDALTGSGTVDKLHSGNSPRLLKVGVDNGSGTFGGTIQNTGGKIAFTKQGSGTQILTGTNTYSGTTTVNAGTLQIGDGGTSGTLGSGGVSIADGAALAFNRSDEYSTPGGLVISGAGSLIKAGSGTLTLSGRNTYSGTTAVQGGVLALASQAALSEGPLSISSGAKVALNFTGQSYVTQLTLGGTVLTAGSYGSSSSPAANQNDTYFSGIGVIYISATIDHVAMATGNLQAADAAWAAGDWAAVRSALSNVFTVLKLDAQWRSIAHLRYARSFQVEGDYTAASAIFGTIAAIMDYPKIHQIEGAECKTECDRLAQALPGRDPEASRVRVTAAPAPGRILHVAPDGDDANPGTLAQPLATVNQALAANRAAGPVAGGTAIELAAGRYPLASTISLTSADSGAGADAPLSIRATTPGTAVISGSQRLTGFTPVTDASVLARLPVEAQGKVMQCDLSALGITDYGSIQEQPMVNLSVNGVQQTLARWPNSGFIPIGGMVDNGNIDQNDPSLNRPQIFTYSGDRPSRWTTATDAWIRGYMPSAWFFGSVAIGSVDPQAKTITTAWTYNRLSGWPDIKSGNPYSVFNLLEEIDQAGEWYLDRSNGMLYWYPSADPDTAVVDLSMLPGSMLTVTNASHVRIEGLVFECSRGSGVELENSSHCLIAGCTVRNLSGVGVRINGGQQNSMIGCDLHDLLQGACFINGGDSNTLTPGGHLVANCRFRNFGISRMNPAGISLNGVGNRITHCVFEDAPSSAIVFSGFNFLVEYNEFRNCCTEVDDFGVIYAWGNPTWRGNIWRFNKFSHCGGGYTQGWLQNRYFGVSAFRFDDAVSGQTVYGNVFNHFDLWGTAAGVMGNNSGRDNIYDNNLVTDSRSLNYGYYDPGNHMYQQGLPNGLSPIHIEAFPELENLFDGKGQNYIWRSTALRVSGGLTSYSEKDWGAWQYIANTNTGTDPGFVEGVELKETIDPTLFWNLGMRAIPVNEIGLYHDSTRAGWIDNPSMAYWNENSGNWDASTSNWSTAETTPASMAWNDNGHTTAVFTGTGGTVTMAAPLSADGLIFTAPGYTLAGTHPLLINAPLTVIDAKNFGATISAPLTGLGGISVAGAGTLTLSGANSYNGTTTVENGTLALSGGDNRLPPDTVVTLGGGGPVAVGTLKLNGCSQELAGLWTADYDTGGGAGNRVLNGSATPCTLTLNIEHSRNNQFEGTLGGPGQNENNFAVRKTGGGGLWLNRSITWTGGTTIEEGTFELNSSWWQNNEAYGSFRIGKGATFAVSGRVSPLYFKGVTVEFLSAGGGTLIQRASPDWMDWRAESGLTIRSTGGERNVFSSAANDYINLVDGANFDIARGSDATCDLLVSIRLLGNSSITKQGDGIMTLSGNNNYTGSTTVSGGILSLTSSGLDNNSSVIVEAGAMLNLDFTGTDQINALWVDGLQLPPGVYSSSSGFITGPGTLTVTTGPASANYATWSGRGIHNLTGGPTDDDDNDSVANLLEYVLGGNPRANSNEHLPAATTSAGNFVFSFRRVNATTTDTTQIFQYGTNLSGWTDVPVVAGGIVAIQPDTPQAGIDTVTITVPKGTEPSLFGRLKVSIPPAPF